MGLLLSKTFTLNLTLGEPPSKTLTSNLASNHKKVIKNAQTQVSKPTLGALNLATTGDEPSLVGDVDI
jgi:hypothetical protein